jgi:hypothetical protein
MLNLTRDTNRIVIRFGFGRNIWDVPFDDITKFYKVRLPLYSPLLN